MVDIMTSWTRRALVITFATLSFFALRVEPLRADHGVGGPGTLSPFVAAILSAVLVLTAAIAIAVIKMILAKKPPPAE
jgi:hypothetical protein